MKATESSTLEAALRYAKQHGLEATAERYPELGEVQHVSCAGSEKARGTLNPRGGECL